MRFAPARHRPSTTIPPPTPVPRMTPNTTGAPAAAPSVASDRAKQFASFITRTGRPSRPSRSRSSGRPLSQVELAFFTKGDGLDLRAAQVDSDAHASARDPRDRVPGARRPFLAEPPLDPWHEPRRLERFLQIGHLRVYRHDASEKRGIAWHELEASARQGTSSSPRHAARASRACPPTVSLSPLPRRSVARARRDASRG